jgi:hypothetical protein
VLHPSPMSRRQLWGDTMDNGWIDMSTWFHKMGLTIPPVPVALQPEVVLRSKCH